MHTYIIRFFSHACAPKPTVLFGQGSHKVQGESCICHHKSCNNKQVQNMSTVNTNGDVNKVRTLGRMSNVFSHPSSSQQLEECAIKPQPCIKDWLIRRNTNRLDRHGMDSLPPILCYPPLCHSMQLWEQILSPLPSQPKHFSSYIRPTIALAIMNPTIKFVSPFSPSTFISLYGTNSTDFATSLFVL